jgi:hypothetical protein
MKKLITIVTIGLLMSSCKLSQQSVDTTPKVVYQTKSKEGKKLYAVIFSDDKALDYMTIEEVQRGLSTGVWMYD